MINNKISNFEFSTLNYFLTRAFLIGITFNILVNVMRQDCWLIPILSIIFAIVIIILITNIISYEPNLNIIEKICKLFNNKISIILVFILFTMFYFISILNYLNLNNFIQSQFLNKTPFIAISIMFASATYYVLSKGIKVLSRTSCILFYINIILFIISLIGLFPGTQLNNLKPMLTTPISGYIQGLNSYYAFNIIPMFLLTIIPKNNIKNPKLKKTLIISYLLSSITLFFIIFQTITVFGYELSKLYEYPQFLVLKHVSLIGLSSRIESILILQLIFDIFILNTVLVYFLSNCIKPIIKVKSSNILYFIICILIIVGTIFISKYNIYIDKYISDIIPTIITITSSIVILIINIKIKMSK